MESFSQPQASNDGAVFKHQPLDYGEPSIRLVRVLPSLSVDGRIQCDISHATVDATYSCLSYRWGNASSLREILVNERPFTVRQNLFDFLSTVQAKAASRVLESSGPYWIDALSIDQANTLERNHQVTQMGQIFSKAERVHLWLGLIAPSISPLLQIIRKWKHATFDEWGNVRSRKDILVKYISDNEYWSRAWVTQEIVLARHVTVWLGADSLGFMEMMNGMEYFDLIGGSDHLRNPFFQFARGWHRDFERPESVISLLAHFRDKKCDDPRDRIFSLLSLCSDQGRNLEVDYNMSMVDLAVRVLHECKESLCLCSAVVVVQSLGLEEKMAPSRGSAIQNAPFLELDASLGSFISDPSMGYRHNLYKGESPLDDEGRHLLNFHDICQSPSLMDVQIPWDDSAVEHQSLVRSIGSNGSFLSALQSAGPYGDGIDVVDVFTNYVNKPSNLGREGETFGYDIQGFVEAWKGKGWFRGVSAT